jgi:hypothetical protein
MKTNLSIQVLGALAIAGVLGGQTYPYVLSDLGLSPGYALW